MIKHRLEMAKTARCLPQVTFFLFHFEKTNQPLYQRKKNLSLIFKHSEGLAFFLVGLVKFSGFLRCAFCGFFLPTEELCAELI